MTERHLLCFVRHGETDWNRAGRMQGSMDIPLNDLGRRQAGDAGRLLATVHPEVAAFRFVSSPLDRTRTTMNLLRDAMGLAAADFAMDDRLRERSWGIWEGSTWAEIGSTSPETLAAHDADRWNFVPADGESYSMVSERLASWIAEIDQPTVAVSHGGVARVVLSMLSDIARVDLPTLEITQGRVLVFEAGTHRWV